MASSILFVSEELDRECVTVPFGAEFHLESSEMTGKFYTLSHHEENARSYKVMSYVWYSDKEELHTTFDVTDQVYKVPDGKHVYIIIDSAGFPEPLSNEDGFDVRADD